MATRGFLAMEIKPSPPIAEKSSRGDEVTVLDHQVLVQTLGRIRSFRESHCWMKRCVVMAVTARSACVCCLTMADNKLTVIRIDHSLIGYLWAFFVHQVDDFWVGDGDDGVPLLKAMEMSNIYPLNCCAKKFFSNKSVYTVTLFNGTVLDPSSATVFKIVTEQRMFEHEQEMLNRVMPSYNTAGIGSYVLSSSELHCDEIDWARVWRRRDFPLDPPPLPCSSSSSRPGMQTRQSTSLTLKMKAMNLGSGGGSKQGGGGGSGEGKGGFIRMKEGICVNIDKFADLKLWHEGVCACLRACHSVGVLHCDIRPPNVLKFDDRFKLIDFDLAAALPASIIPTVGAESTFHAEGGFETGDGPILS